MDVFNGNFLESLNDSIVKVVAESIETLTKDSVPEVRYLQKKDARKYIGGINPTDFTNLVAMGLPEIKVGRSIRYDKKDIDEFMAKHRY